MLKQLLEPKDEVLSGKLQGVISEPFDVSAAPSTSSQQSLPLNQARPGTSPTTGGASASGTTGTTDTSATPQPRIADVGTGFLPSRQQLRQEVARLFEENEDSQIVSVMEVLVPWIELEPR